MSWAARQLAIRAAYAAALPIGGLVPDERIDKTALGGKPFTPPVVPALLGLDAAEKLAALQGAIWIRIAIVGVLGGRPMHLGAWSKTETQGSVHQQIFYPAGYGEDFVAPVVDAALAVFHRQSYLGADVRFHDSLEPVRLGQQEQDSKFAQINTVTPATFLGAVAA